LRSFFTSDASAELANIADRTVYIKEKSTIDVVRDDAKVEMADRNVVAKDAEVENARNIISKVCLSASFSMSSMPLLTAN